MGQHYIFFESLSTNDQKKAFQSRISAGLGNINMSQKESFIKNSEAVNYIKDFLNMIKNLADTERNNELAFLQKTIGKEIGISGEEFKNLYFNNDNFNYLQFIADLNLVKKDKEQLKKNIQMTRERMNTVNDIMKEASGQKLIRSYRQGKETVKQQFTFNQEQVEQLYTQHLMPKFRASIMSALAENQKRMGQTVTASFTQKVNTIIKNIANNATIMNIVKKIVEQGVRQPEELKAAIISASMSIASNIYNEATRITKNSVNEYITKHTSEIETAMNEGINKISLKNSQKKRKTLEDFLNAAIDKTGGLINLYLELPMEQKQKLSKLVIGDKIFKLVEDYNKAISTGRESITKAKGNFTSAVYSIIDHVKDGTDKKDKQTQITRIREEIMSRVNSNLAKIPESNINIQQLLQKAFIIDDIKVSEMSEIKHAVEMYIKSKAGCNIQQVFFPGSVIQLKNDFSFTYHYNSIEEIEGLNPQQLESIIDLRTLMTKQGQHFLQRYNSTGKGSTNIEIAYNEYINTLKQIQKKQEQTFKLLEKEGKDLQSIKKFLDNIFVSVSVKQYAFYNDTYGYGAGSLGGGGKVVQAVPNLLKMIQLGGITPPEAEVVIDALLNSFPQSAIKTNYVEDLKNFLLVGAAMMLFDDGFTSGKTFLEGIKKQIGSILNTPTMHLILVDSFYFPQSYILQNIYERLLEIYNKILQEAAPERLTTGARAQLVLHNDINSNILEQMYKKEGDPWENMSNYAEENVTISYFFMAGMIDILQSLGNIV